MKKRMKFLRYLHKVMRVKEGEVSPKLLKWIYYVLFPCSFYVEKLHHIKYNVCSDIYTIEGREFSGSMLIEIYYKHKHEPTIKEV